MKRWAFLAATIAAAGLVACGGSGGSDYSTGPSTTPTGGTKPSGGTSSPNEVTMQDQAFLPGTVTVPKGTVVTWKWPACDATGGYGGYGSSCISHSVIFDDNVASPEQNSGTFTRAFPTAGTFNYHCGVHGTAMAGKVVVQ